MKNGSILIISNNKEIGNSIAGKVKLLRECDSIQIITYIEAVSALNEEQPSLIMVYSSSSDSIGIVKEIRSLKRLDKVPIILVMDYFSEDMLLYAFDNGIDDFFFLNDSDSVILIRILLTLQKSILYKQLEISNNILSAAGILDLQSGIYTKEQAAVILRNVFSSIISETHEDAVFMCIKPVAAPGGKTSIQTLTQAVTNSIKKMQRGNDIITFGREKTLYLILNNTGIAGAKSVFQRIKRAVKGLGGIYSAAALITAPFSKMESVLLQCVNNQIETEVDFNFLDDITFNNAAGASNSDDFSADNAKKEFFAKFEQLAAPVFYQMRKKAAEKLPYAAISFDIAETESRFDISQDKNTAGITIVSPDAEKVIIDIKRAFTDEKPVSDRRIFDFDQFSPEELSSLLEEQISAVEEKHASCSSESSSNG